MYITLVVFSESSMGLFSPEDQTMQAWTWFHRTSPGHVFENADSSNPVGCPTHCSAWADVINDYLEDGLTYTQASPEQRMTALIKAHECYTNNACNTRWHDEYRNTMRLVKNAYKGYVTGGFDPVDGTTIFSHPSELTRGGMTFQDGWGLYYYLLGNFYQYKQVNPDFRYAIGEPFLFPYPDGSQWKTIWVLYVTANDNCASDSSCGQP